MLTMLLCACTPAAKQTEAKEQPTKAAEAETPTEKPASEPEPELVEPELDYSERWRERPIPESFDLLPCYAVDLQKMIGQFSGEDKGGQGAVVPLLQETLPHPAVLADGCVGRGIEDQIRNLNVTDRDICDVHFDTSFNESDGLRAGAAFAGRKYAFRAGSEDEFLHNQLDPSPLP
jgi:hypothetical protein